MEFSERKARLTVMSSGDAVIETELFTATFDHTLWGIKECGVFLAWNNAELVSIDSPSMMMLKLRTPKYDSKARQ